MKKLFKVSLGALLISSSIIFSGCGGDGDTSKSVTEQLKKSPLVIIENNENIDMIKSLFKNDPHVVYSDKNFHCTNYGFTKLVSENNIGHVNNKIYMDGSRECREHDSKNSPWSGNSSAVSYTE